MASLNTVILTDINVMKLFDYAMFHVSSCESGSVPAASIEALSAATKPHPSPPPGLTPPADEGRTGLKGTDSRPLEKVKRLSGKR